MIPLERPLVATAVSCLAFSAATVHTAQAAPLTGAELTRINNQVSMIDPAVGKRPAVVRDVVQGGLAVDGAIIQPLSGGLGPGGWSA